MARAYWGRHYTQSEGPATQAQLILMRESYDRLFSDPPPFVALDTETVSLKDKSILGLGISTPDNDNFYFDFIESSLPWHLIMPSSVRKIWHNAPFDLSWEVWGKFGADIDNIEDTVILTRLLNIDTELSTVSEDMDTQTQSAKEMLAEVKEEKGINRPTMRDLSWDQVAHKCMRDSRVTMELYLKYKDKVSAEYYEVERKVTSILLHMSHRGIKLDQELTSKIENELGTRARLYIDLCRTQGFNPLSPQQVAYTLSANHVHLPWKRRAKQPSTDNEALEEIDHPYASLTLLARKYNKLHGVVKPLFGSELVRSHFRSDAITGRITSSDIQMHNLPTGKRPGDIMPNAGPIRRIFLANSGVFTRWDLSQIELRILAYLSGDKYMSKILSLPKDQGGDIHVATQVALGLSDKLMAKNFNFGSIYGGNVSILSKFTGIKDLGLLGMYQEKLGRTYPEAWLWIQEQRRQGLRDMKVETIYGRVLKLGTDYDMGEKHIQNCAVNYPIQGSAAEIFKRMLVELASSMPIEDMILQVHDEVLLDGRYDELDIDSLAHISPMWTPLEISYPERWQ